jgi:4a-hydroxytetrahydrobiopterin dehydratase
MGSDLTQKHCESCEGIGAVLQSDQIQKLVPQLNANWHVSNDHKEIQRAFTFTNFYETMAFVNALAFMAHQENHHPDIEMGYNYCRIRYMTHALGGLSLNDFICAAKVDKLILG